jgi:hypothetical protein
MDRNRLRCRDPCPKRASVSSSPGGLIPPVTLPVRGDDPPDEYSNFALLLQQFPRWNAKLEYSVPPAWEAPPPISPWRGSPSPIVPSPDGARDGACGAEHVSSVCRCWSAVSVTGISVAGPVLWEVRSWVAGTLRVVVYNSTGG